MVIIRFPNGTEWFNPNWVFRQLLADIVEMFPEDTKLKYEMEKAEALGSLFLDYLSEVDALRILDAIKRVSEDTVQGKIQGWSKEKPTDEEGQRMYLEAIAELLDHIKGCISTGK